MSQIKPPTRPSTPFASPTRLSGGDGVPIWAGSGRYRSVRAGRVNSSLPVRRLSACTAQAGTQTGAGVKSLDFYCIWFSCPKNLAGVAMFH